MRDCISCYTSVCAKGAHVWHAFWFTQPMHTRCVSCVLIAHGYVVCVACVSLCVVLYFVLHSTLCFCVCAFFDVLVCVFVMQIQCGRSGCINFGLRIFRKYVIRLYECRGLFVCFARHSSYVCVHMVYSCFFTCTKKACARRVCVSMCVRQSFTCSTY